MVSSVWLSRTAVRERAEEVGWAVCPLNRWLPRILEQYFSFFSSLLSFGYCLCVCVCGLASFNKLFRKTTHGQIYTKLIHTRRRCWIDARWCINEREREKWIKRSTSILLFLLAADVFFWSFHYESRVGSRKISPVPPPWPKALSHINFAIANRANRMFHSTFEHRIGF